MKLMNISSWSFSTIAAFERMSKVVTFFRCSSSACANVSIVHKLIFDTIFFDEIPVRSASAACPFQQALSVLRNFRCLFSTGAVTSEKLSQGSDEESVASGPEESKQEFQIIFCQKVGVFFFSDSPLSTGVKKKKHWPDERKKKERRTSKDIFLRSSR